MVMKHKGLILGMTTFGLLAALLVSFVRTPLYLASTTLQVDKRAAQVVQFNKDDALGGNQEGGDERTAMGTYLELLKSRVLAERVIDELQLDRMALPDQDTDQLTTPQDQADADADAAQRNSTGWTAMFEQTWHKIQDSYGKVRRPTATNSDTLNREKVVEAYQKTVNIEQVRNSRMMKVSVENASPQLASRIANTIGQQFIALNLERRMDSSSYAKNFLEGQLGITKAKLEESERKLQEYARAKNILTLDEKTNVANQTFVEFAAALAKAEQDLFKAESEYEAIRTAPDTAKQVLDNKTIQSYKEQRVKLEAEYLENAKVYKDDFPKMQQLKEKVAEYDAKIKQEMEATLVSVRNNLTMTKRQVALIQGRVAGARGEIVSGQERGVEFNMMKREVDTNRELYNGLLQQLKQVGVAGGVETNNIQMVDKAEVPLFPHKPKLGLNAAIGLIAGLVLGLVLVFLMESLDDSIKFADEVEKVLQVPLLGVIPKVKPVAGLSSMALLAHEDPEGTWQRLTDRCGRRCSFQLRTVRPSAWC
jgi:succinoglycan biosynthesis transport protein ExoP